MSILIQMTTMFHIYTRASLSYFYTSTPETFSGFQEAFYWKWNTGLKWIKGICQIKTRFVFGKECCEIYHRLKFTQFYCMGFNFENKISGIFHVFGFTKIKPTEFLEIECLIKTISIPGFYFRFLSLCLKYISNIFLFYQTEILKRHLQMRLKTNSYQIQIDAAEISFYIKEPSIKTIKYHKKYRKLKKSLILSCCINHWYLNWILFALEGNLAHNKITIVR